MMGIKARAARFRDQRHSVRLMLNGTVKSKLHLSRRSVSAQTEYPFESMPFTIANLEARGGKHGEKRECRAIRARGL